MWISNYYLANINRMRTENRRDANQPFGRRIDKSDLIDSTASTSRLDPASISVACRELPLYVGITTTHRVLDETPPHEFLPFFFLFFFSYFRPLLFLILLCFGPLICCLFSSADPKNGLFLFCVSIPCSPFTLISASDLDVLHSRCGMYIQR
ncbi:hypothetical protein GGR53DRAFT_452052 [Hypoxylon sp. FL1150]|nr:hypothetical protein GGR53DRAFT_452052 [Hypoxylon sp. FL1150]